MPPTPHDPASPFTPGPLLAGRRVLVVGAGTSPSDDPDAPPGNGRAIALAAAREGAAVACSDLDAAAARRTAGMITDEGGTAHALPAADAADPGAAARTVEQAAAALGGLDGLVHNAGIGIGYGLAGTDPADWDRVLAVNLRAPFLSARAALPLLEPGAAIVLIGSLAGTKPGSRSPSYDASKAGLTGLLRHLAAEAAPRGVRANLLAPGLIDTVMGRAASAGNADRDRTARLVPLGRQGTAHEVAAAAGFLLSDRASYITGQVLHVDGGLSTLR
ncbi:SDR family NAD(P)-dependent oxidoreductase [Actinomadura rupiterrae]|uniref:SDR family NAD(P)-dependent oxidoreductase n=1 Tax=Actinomadura rupiterrae TaxID=559627 RepID=UPI0020A3999A|nr:SDR family oxidoreductase [Actinomadura rupiterrae]MCP2343076.1 NAD(P)-dependent dehydrogenase (short-subunit alcohol dehydrogenase family) [Actinomadura rupiterrae]